MSYPLLMRTLLNRGRTYFAHKMVASRNADGTVHRYTYGEYARRVFRLANALDRLGVGPGEKVATLAWNHHRHFELYLGVPCKGSVLHTVNIRLHPSQVAFILNHAADKVVFLDPDMIPLVEAIAPDLKTVQHYVIMCDGPLPATRLPNVHSYEDLLAHSADAYDFPDLDENAPAAMCFTSATTGNPKGVVYSHRTMYLHTLAVLLPDSLAMAEPDVIMPVVPMFHVNAWGLPFAALFMGANLVLPGPRPTPQDLAQLIAGERVTMAAGVPTVWLGMLAALEREPLDISALKTLVVGGSAAPRSMIEAWDRRGVTLLHAYGMTEAAPVTHVCKLQSDMAQWPYEQQVSTRAKQGLLVGGLEMRVVGENGQDVPWDGKTMGEVWLRGPWIADAYYNDPRTAETFVDGWYHTGDVAVVDPRGYLQLVDRTKDLVKSGGEWISTVDLENELMAHPAVREAAVIAVPNLKYMERPLACVVLKEGARATEHELLDFLAAKVAKWWVPDGVEFLDEIPKGATGKFDKKVLRERFKNWSRVGDL
jgi:fatty-acyl-CoA synthase